MIRKAITAIRRLSRLGRGQSVRAKPQRPPHPQVLVYHGVVDRITSAELDQWSLTRDDFAAQVVLMRRDWNIVSLQTVTNALIAGVDLPPDWLCITFDDAFANVFRNARPILSEHGIPYTVAVPTGLVDTRRTIWSLEVRMAIMVTKQALLPKSLSGFDEDLPLTSSDQRRRIASRLVTEFLRKPDTDRRTTVEQLVAHLLPTANEDTVQHHPETAIMTGEQVVHLANEGVTIASHGHFHSPLNESADSACLQRELADSRQALETLIDRPIDLFIYPFGLHTTSSTTAVREAGYQAAFITQNKPVVPNTDRFLIPRVSMGADMRCAQRVLA